MRSLLWRLLGSSFQWEASVINFLLGAVAFIVAGATFLFFLPRGGKPSPIAGAKFEAYFVVGLIAILGLGIGLIIEGATTALK